MRVVSIGIFVLLLLLVGVVGLQIFLSKRRNKWWGLVIPFVCFLYSIFLIFNLAVGSSGTMTETTIAGDGTVVSQQSTPVQGEKVRVGAVCKRVIPIFLIGNLPTAFYLMLYFICRTPFKKKRELDKMQIQDLE